MSTHDSPIADMVNLSGKPDAGNLHVRFDEGDQIISGPYSTGKNTSRLY